MSVDPDEILQFDQQLIAALGHACAEPWAEEVDCPECGGLGQSPLPGAGAGHVLLNDACPTCGGSGCVLPRYPSFDAWADAWARENPDTRGPVRFWSSGRIRWSVHEPEWPCTRLLVSMWAGSLLVDRRLPTDVSQRNNPRAMMWNMSTAADISPEDVAAIEILMRAVQSTITPPLQRVKGPRRTLDFRWPNLTAAISTQKERP